MFDKRMAVRQPRINLQVLQNAPPFAVFSGTYLKTSVSEQVLSLFINSINNTELIYQAVKRRKCAQIA
jgi:hypothetical protein